MKTQPRVSDLDISPLIRPQSVLFIGASQDPNKISGKPLGFTLRETKHPRLAVVHPHRDSVQGVPSIGPLDQARSAGHGFDVAVITLPAEQATEAVEACADLGVKFAVVIPAGFREAGRGDLEDRVIAACDRSGMKVVGPNTAGVLSYVGGYRATISFAANAPGPTTTTLSTAFISGSGGVMSNYVPRFLEASMDLAYIINTGNGAVSSTSDYLSAVARDETIHTVLAYIEGVQEGEDLAGALVLLQETGKNCIVYMVPASSAEVSRAIGTHTGRIVQPDSVVRAICRYTNTVLVDTLPDLERAYEVMRHRKIRGRNVGIFVLSGGEGVMLASRAVQRGLRVPALSDATQEALAQVVPPFGSTTNPVDGTPSIWERPDPQRAFAHVIGAMAQSGEVDAVLVGGAPPMQQTAMVSGLRESIRNSPVPIVTTMALPPDLAQGARRDGLAIVPDLTGAVDALAAVVASNEVPADWRQAAQRLPDLRENVRKDVFSGPATSHETLLRNFGLPLVSTVLVRAITDVPKAASLIPGPWVAKLRADGLSHRSDVDAVRVALHSEDELRSAVQDILAIAQRLDLDEVTVEVQPHVKARHEILVAVKTFESYGRFAVVGYGGNMAEIVSEAVTMPLEVLTELAIKEIGRLFGGRYVSHARGLSAHHTQALAGLVARLAEFVAAHPEIAEIEFNPVAVLDSGELVILDWLISSAVADSAGQHPAARVR